MTAILKFIIAKFWPVIIPLLLYVMWLTYVRIKNKEGEKVNINKKHVKAVIYSMLITTIACLIYFFASTSPDKRTFVPTRIENGVIVPSQVK